MTRFKNKEEYERWKAERLKQTPPPTPSPSPMMHQGTCNVYNMNPNVLFILYCLIAMIAFPITFPFKTTLPYYIGQFIGVSIIPIFFITIYNLKKGNKVIRNISSAVIVIWTLITVFAALNSLKTDSVVSHDFISSMSASPQPSGNEEEFNLKTGEYYADTDDGNSMNLKTHEYYMNMGDGDLMNLKTHEYYMNIGDGDLMNLKTREYYMNMGDGDLMNLD